MILKPKNREEWLSMREKVGIGGSEAGTVLGYNKYMSNVDLWKVKTGRAKAEDISDKPAVKYGKQAEEHLRELFKLDFPEYVVDYHEFYMYVNDKYKWLFATLDGEITDENSKRGILEIKTTTIRNSTQWEDWDNRIPNVYYAQVLHQLAATGWDFVILKAHIRYNKNGDLAATERHYRIDRTDVTAEIEYLIQQEQAFVNAVNNDTMPPLILPEI